MAQVTDDTKHTGWDNGLSQDYNAKLGTWFADRLGARQQLREDFSDDTDPFAGEHQDDIDGLTWWARVKQYWSGLWK